LPCVGGGANLNVSLAESKAGKAASNPQHSTGFADPHDPAGFNGFVAGCLVPDNTAARLLQPARLIG
jgi:hypothetical protein